MDLRRGDNTLLVFNPLAEAKVEVVTAFLETSDNVCVEDQHGNLLDYQVRRIVCTDLLPQSNILRIIIIS